MNLIKRIFTPPIFPGEEDKTIVAQSLHVLLLAAIVVASLAFVVFAVIAPESLPRVLATDLPILLVLLASWLLVQRGQVRVAAMLVVGIAWVGSTLSSVLAGGLKSSLFGVGSMLVVLLSGFLLGQWELLGLIALNILTGIAIAWADTQGWIPLVPASVNPTSILMSYALNLFAAAAAMYVAINSLRSALNRARQDLMERKLAEEALRESEAKFRTIIEQSSEGILLVDETGKIIEWNQAYARLTGISSAQAIGMPLWEVQYRLFLPNRQSPERFQEIKTAVLNALASGNSPMFNRPFDATIQIQDGEERHLVQNAFCIKTDKGNRIASLIRDATDYTNSRRLTQSVKRPHPN
jgi:PAS domain S-box-containing protein